MDLLFLMRPEVGLGHPPADRRRGREENMVSRWEVGRATSSENTAQIRAWPHAPRALCELPAQRPLAPKADP